MKTTTISIQNTGATLTMQEEPDDSLREDRGQHCVRITLPDGREFRYVDDSGAEFQDVIELTERDGWWGARFGYIPVAGCVSSAGDYYGSDELEFTSRDAALASGLDRARELGVPLLERTCPGDAKPPQYTCLFQPTQVIVADRLGEVVFTARDGALEPVCEGLLDDDQMLHEIVVSESMEPAVLSGLVHEAWGAACAVTVRPLPVINPSVKGVRA
jgi:hypothetical protein